MSVSPIQIDTTQIRTQAPRNPYGLGGADKFFNGLQTAMGLIGPAVSAGVGMASPTGGAVTSAALSVLGGQNTGSYGLGGSPSALTKFGGIGNAPGFGGGAAGGLGGAGGMTGFGGGTQVDMAMQMQAMQSMNNDMLSAQMAVQNENRLWSMLSQIKKAEHDTLKQAINNMRAG